MKTFVILIALSLCSLTGCDDHDGQTCLHETYVPPVYVKSGGALIPVGGGNVCDAWSTPTTAP